MPDVDPTRRIPTRRRGNHLGFWFFRTALRLTGLRGAYGLLYFVCLHYLLFDRTAVRAARAYISRRFPGHGPLARTLAIYRLFINQGKNLIDRHCLISGAIRFDIEFEGRDRLAPLLSRPPGFILLMTHMGNWQFILATIGNLDRNIRLVMRPEDNPAVQEAVGVDRQDSRISLISPEGFMGGVIEITQALKQGDIVCMMGDRTYGFVSQPARFLGDTARLPAGPFAIAAATGAPILVLFPAKVGHRRYRIRVADILHPPTDPGIRRENRLAETVQSFATLMESYVAEHPYQCFLFHDIWSPPATPAPTRHT